jgi:hypothetical protein
MNPRSNATAENSLLRYSAARNNIQIQQSLGVEDQEYLLPNNLSGNQAISKSGAKSSTEFKTQSVNGSNGKSKQQSIGSALTQNMSHVPIPVVGTRPMMHETVIFHNAPYQMPIQQTVSPPGYQNIVSSQW